MTQPDRFTFAVGSWAFSAAHGESVRILDVETVWNHTVYQLWIPRLATVERGPVARLPRDPAINSTSVKPVCETRIVPQTGFERTTCPQIIKPQNQTIASSALAFGVRWAFLSVESRSDRNVQPTSLGLMTR